MLGPNRQTLGTRADLVVWMRLGVEAEVLGAFPGGVGCHPWPGDGGYRWNHCGGAPMVDGLVKRLDEGL
jgi:hypothetical protein